MSIICAAALAAESRNPFLGTWEYDGSKSSFVGRLPYQRAKITFSRYEGGVAVVEEVVVNAGALFHFEYRDLLDGKDVPVTGNPYYNSQSTVWTDDHTLTRTEKRDGVVIGTTTMTMAADGKSFMANARRTVPGGGTYIANVSWKRARD
jgi:hypothetical protein